MNYKRTKLFLVFILGFLHIMMASYADDEKINQNLVFKLSMPHVEYLATDKLTLNFTATNTTANPITFLKWKTPLENDFTGDIFTVKYQGKRVNYTGKLVKRATPTEEDFITLAAGETITGSLDLSEGYSIQNRGDYTIALNQELKVVTNYAEKGLFEMQLKPAAIHSAAISFTLNEKREQEKIAEKQANFSSCNVNQKNALNNALTAAVGLADDSVNLLKHSTVSKQSLGRYYKKWFGTYKRARYSAVTNNFSKIHNALAKKQVVFDCSCSENFFAYVYSNQPYKIYLCNSFWRANLRGTDSKAGTLIHEVSHFTKVADTDDHVYGQAGAKQLAVDRPDKAIQNADNHEYFAEGTEKMFKEPITNISITSANRNKNYCSSGYKRLSVDLNEGAGGKYIYFCLARKVNRRPISNIIITKKRCPSGYYKYKTDLNKGTRTHRNPLYLCTTRKTTISAITRMKVTTGNTRANQCGSLYPYRTMNLNQGARGKYVYICYN